MKIVAICIFLWKIAKNPVPLVQNLHESQIAVIDKLIHPG